MNKSPSNPEQEGKKETTLDLKQSLENLLKKDTKLRKSVQKGEVEHAWFSLMDKTVVPYTHKLRFKDGTLTVWITSAPLREELSRGKKEIINNLNKFLGKELIRKIIFR